MRLQRVDWIRIAQIRDDVHVVGFEGMHGLRDEFFASGRLECDGEGVLLYGTTRGDDSAEGMSRVADGVDGRRRRGRLLWLRLQRMKEKLISGRRRNRN